MIKHGIFFGSLVSLFIIGATPSTAQSDKSKTAKCDFGDGIAVSCTFTPLRGDGSFSIRNGSNFLIFTLIRRGQMRVAAIFDGRVASYGTYYRVPDDPACWHNRADGDTICAW